MADVRDAESSRAAAEQLPRDESGAAAGGEAASEERDASTQPPEKELLCTICGLRACWQ